VSLISRFGKLDNVVLGAIRVATAVLLLVMFGVIIAGVICRYVLDRPLSCGEELAKYVMFYMVLIGSAAASRAQQHPALTFIVRKFPPLLDKIWRVLIDAMVCFVLIIILIEGWKMALDERIMRTPTLRISFLWVYLALPIGAFLMMLEIIAKYVFGKKTFENSVESTSAAPEV
jgi:TRAP-type C4-dicarboxylate transport system permease small subunit